MNNLRIDQLLRYLAAGFIAIAVGYVSEPEKTRFLLSELNALGTCNISAYPKACCIPWLTVWLLSLASITATGINGSHERT